MGLFSKVKRTVRRKVTKGRPASRTIRRGSKKAHKAAARSRARR